MKKLFTLIALVMCFLGAKALTVTDYTTTFNAEPTGWKAGWWTGADDAEIKGSIAANEDGLHLTNTSTGENFWDNQLWIADGIALDVDETYTVKIVAKTDGGSATVRCRVGDWSGGVAGEIVVTGSSYQEYTYTGTSTTSSNGLLIQFADYLGTVSFKSLTITHEQAKESRPVEWYDIMDPSQPYVYSIYKSLENEVASISSEEIYALVKEVPATDGVYAYTTTGFNKEDYTVNSKGDDISGNYGWANQLFIKSPEAIKSGETVKISFDYKATSPANTNTQAHGLPTYYQHWQLLGDVKFTEDWQTFSKEVTISADQAGSKGMISIAFNLNPDVQAENTYYLKNIKIEKMKLDQGLFVAATNTESGLVDYDFDNAVQFEFNSDFDAMAAIVGTEGDKDSWVNEIMISTVRGNDKAFKGATIKAAIKNNEDWVAYAAGSNAKIKLPAAGVYMVLVDQNQGLVAISQIEGDEIISKEEIEINANATVAVVNAVEREYKKDEEIPEGYVFKETKLNEETFEEEPVYGNDWDNQFCIMANRALEEGEETVISFDYVATTTATSGTQCGGSTAGAYVHWNCIGNVDFTEEVQHFEKTFTVPAEANGMQSITFNLALLKGANNYTFKNIIWKLADNTESLIDQEGTKNFIVKEGAGTKPYEFGTENPNAVEAVAADANTAVVKAVENGQVVIVKNGKKYNAVGQEL